MAEALPGLLTALGCAGFGAQLPDKALVPGVRQHVALPLTGEFSADVGVHEHGLLLSTLTWGFAAGFADSAHLTRTAVRMNGFTPTKMPFRMWLTNCR
jgi:hypothetical protein